MKSVELKATSRSEVKNKSILKSLRKEGRVPATIYGGKENVNFHVDEIAFSKLINTSAIYLIDLNFGDKTIRSVIRDVQFHAVTDKPIHIDFMEVFEDKPIVIGVPVRFVGKSIGVLNGGSRREKLRKIVLKAIPANIPEDIEVDVTKLRIGYGIKIEDLDLEGVEFMDHPKAVIVAVKTSRVAIEDEEVEDEEGEEGEGEEGEKTEGAAEGAPKEEAPAVAE